MLQNIHKIKKTRSCGQFFQDLYQFHIKHWITLANASFHNNRFFGYFTILKVVLLLCNS